MSTAHPSEPTGGDGPAARRRRRRWPLIAGVALVFAVAATIGLQHAADADEITRLKRYTPHGHHFIDTALSGGPVVWTSREIMIWKVRRKTREFPTLEAFKAAFLQADPPLLAAVSVHHPALNLNTPEGRASHQRAEAILSFLAEEGYTNGGSVSD